MDALPSAEDDVLTRVSDKLMYTTQSQFRYVFTIDLDDLQCITVDHNSVISPPFSTNGQDVWYVKFADENTCYKVYLGLYATNKTHIEATYKFTIIDNNMGETFSKSCSDTCIFVPETVRAEHGIEFVNGDDLYDSTSVISQDADTFDVLCEVTVLLKTDIVDVSKNGDNDSFNLPKCRIVDDVTGLFATREFSDVAINVCGRQVRAHKTILAMRCPFFRAMFNEMTPKTELQIKITDVDYEVFDEVLRFIYTGEVQNIEKITDKLLAVADKYQLDRLKVMCEVVLRSNLAVENAAEMFILADLYNAQNLKTTVAKYIDKNLAKVTKTKSFRSKTKSHPTLLNEVLQLVMGRKLKTKKSTRL